MEDRILELVNRALRDLNYADCFLVELKVNNSKVEVFLDSDDNVSFEKCRKISRFMEEILDEEKWLGEKYTLDISSAGVGRPLLFGRQYVKNIGRTLEVKTTDDQKLKGKILSADEVKVTLEIEKKEKVGKKRVKIIEAVDVTYTDIKEAKIKVSF